MFKSFNCHSAPQKVWQSPNSTSLIINIGPAKTAITILRTAFFYLNFERN